MTNEEAMYELEGVISDIELAGIKKGDNIALNTLKRVAKHLLDNSLKPFDNTIPNGQYLFYSDKNPFSSSEFPFWVGSFPNPNMSQTPTYYMSLPEIPKERGDE